MVGINAVKALEAFLAPEAKPSISPLLKEDTISLILLEAPDILLSNPLMVLFALSIYFLYFPTDWAASLSPLSCYEVSNLISSLNIAAILSSIKYFLSYHFGLFFKPFNIVICNSCILLLTIIPRKIKYVGYFKLFPTVYLCYHIHKPSGLFPTVSIGILKHIIKIIYFPFL
jgi:hypothetical protein